MLHTHPTVTAVDLTIQRVDPGAMQWTGFNHILFRSLFEPKALIKEKRQILGKAGKLQGVRAGTLANYV